jgi:hypothetical protein
MIAALRQGSQTIREHQSQARSGVENSRRAFVSQLLEPVRIFSIRPFKIILEMRMILADRERNFKKQVPKIWRVLWPGFKFILLIVIAGSVLVVAWCGYIWLVGQYYLYH